MGTSAVGNAATILPLHLPGETGLEIAAWLLSSTALVVLALISLSRVLRGRPLGASHPGEAIPTAVFFHGCPPMAILSVGFGTLSIGHALIGAAAATDADEVLWTAGTVYSLAIAARFCYLLICRLAITPIRASPSWLLPIVPPLVSAALGPALIPHLPSRPGTDLLYTCGLLFGTGMIAVALFLPIVITGLIHDRPFTVALTPTLFIVLGPLGQSSTAATQLSRASLERLPPHWADTCTALAATYGTAITGFALLWLVISLAANISAVRHGMTFSITWWSSTFPIGTCVTGTAGLGVITGFRGFTALALGLYALLLVMWVIAAAGTLRTIARSTKLPRSPTSTRPA